MTRHERIMMGVGKVGPSVFCDKDGNYTCFGCGDQWSPRETRLWWPIRVALSWPSRNPRPWFTRHGIERTNPDAKIGQRSIATAVRLGPIVVVFG